MQLQPESSEAHNGLGLALMKQGKLDEALANFRRAVRLKPDYAVAQSNVLLCLSYRPDLDPDAVFAEHRRWASQYEPAMVKPAMNNRDPNRRLRIGYVSPDLCHHVVACFLEPILANHDMRQVAVACYAEVPQPDAATARLRSLVSGWRSTCGLSDVELAALVRDDEIDVLIDLAGHTSGNRLGAFASKPAPIQITYQGYCNTTGLTSIDYRLTDAVADPPEEPSRYTEELVRLPGCFCCYAPPPAPPVSPLPARKSGRITFGCLHDLAKLNAGVIRVWSALLRGIPEARLVICRHTLHGTPKENLQRQFSDQGIAADRLELRDDPASGSGYLSRYEAIDILLDVFPWNGHATTCEALWMGVPVITLRGNRHAGRLSATILAHLGLSGWIAPSPEAYVALAVRMARDLERLTSLRADLRRRMASSPLCNGKAFTCGLEQVYRALWQRWCARSSPFAADAC